MDQQRFELGKVILRAGRSATVLLAGILAGAVAAYGVSAQDDAQDDPPGPSQAMLHGWAPEANIHGAGMLDIQSLRTAATFGHALVALRGTNAAPDRSASQEAAIVAGCIASSTPRTFALVDPMLVPQGRAELAQLAGLAQLPSGIAASALILPGMTPTGDEPIAQFLPWLVELPEAPGPRETLARLTMGWARERHGAVWISSECSIDGLAMLLGRAMVARLDDGRAAMVRLADARVLESLRGMLDLKQEHALWGLAMRWRYLDRSAQLTTIDAPLPRADDRRYWEPLEFSEQRLAELMQAAEPDEVLSYVSRLAGDRLSAMAASERLSFATRQIVAAKALGMHSSQEFGIYAAIALKEGDDFLAKGPWQRALEQVRRGEQSWVQVLTSDGFQR